jgi:hypothetical protein
VYLDEVATDAARLGVVGRMIDEQSIVDAHRPQLALLFSSTITVSPPRRCATAIVTAPRRALRGS